MYEGVLGVCMGVGGVTVVFKVVRGNFTDNLTYEHRPERSRKQSCGNMGESIPRKGITRAEMRGLLDVSRGKQRGQHGWIELAWKRGRRRDQRGGGVQILEDLVRILAFTLS